MLHAKAVIVDDLAIIGSANMDMRSLFLNYEVALFLYCHAQVEETANWARSLMPDARRAARRSAGPPSWPKTSSGCSRRCCRPRFTDSLPRAVDSPASKIRERSRGQSALSPGHQPI